MFVINYSTQGSKTSEDLKIVIKFKESQEYTDTSIVELQTSFDNACIISDLISHNVERKDQTYIFNIDIILNDKHNFTISRYVELITSLLNNHQIKYSEENSEILHEISRLFNIKTLKLSIERYISYIDEINQYNIGRLPLIDAEFLCQLYLLDLSEDNFDDTLNASYLFISEITTDTFFQIFYRCIFSRLPKTATYLTFIVNKLNSYISDFLRVLMRNYRLFSFGHNYDDYNLGVVCFLLRFFIENGYMSRGDDESFNYQVGWRSYSYQFFDFDDGYIHYNSTYYVFRHYDDLAKNNYELHRKLVLNGKNQNPLFQIIEKDDVESLQNLIAFDPSVDVDTTIESCYYESRPLFQTDSYSLIEIAAFFGSINVFKFLLVNNAILRKDKLRVMALYGGNTEIIRICQQNGIDYNVSFLNQNSVMSFEIDTSLMIAIKMNYFDLLRWLIEEEQFSFENSKIDLIGYCLRCCNFVAFYYLIQVKSEDQAIQIDFSRYLNEIVISNNIPIIKNYLLLKDENLLELPKVRLNYSDRYFFENLVICNDINFIELFLKDNKIVSLSDVPYEYISSLTYQRICRYLLKHQNVTFSTKLFMNIIEDLLISDDDQQQETTTNNDNINNIPIKNIKTSPEFISEQIDLLYEKTSSIEEKILLLPVIIKYNLYENKFINKYKDLLESNDTVQFTRIIENRNIFIGFLKYANCEVLKYLLQRMDDESKNKFKKSHNLINYSLETDRLDTFLFLISSEFSPFSEIYKFDEESFFEYFYKIKSIEILKKIIQIYDDKIKDCNFYKDIFLPNALFNAADLDKEMIEYLLNLPEIEPFINKPSEKYNNLPPLLYIGQFYCSVDVYKPFFDSEKVDINIRDSENNRNILSFISDCDSLILLLSNKMFKYTSEDVTSCIENSRYPGRLDLFEFFLNGLLDEKDINHANPLKLKIEFTDEQLSRIFNKLCITDDRLEFAKRFYSKFSDRINVNYVDERTNSFCLLDAIDCDCCKMVEFLLSIPELDLNIRGTTGSVNSHMSDSSDITPFCFAVVCEKDEVIHLFFKRKSDFDVNATFSEGITCLHYAAQNDNTLLIKKLLNFPDINVNATDNISYFFF